MVVLLTTNLPTHYMQAILILIHHILTPMHILVLTRVAVKVYPGQDLIPQGTVSIRGSIKVLAAAE